MAIMTFTELENSLLDVLPQVGTYSPLIFDYYTNLYNLGCRPTELRKTNLWQKLSPIAYKLNPTKNNFPRYFDATLLSDNLKDAIDMAIPDPYGFLYYKQLYFFKKWYMYDRPRVGSKGVDLYLFRHHYVKKLYEDGMPIPTIVLNMGWINPLMAENYIFSVIEYTP